MGKQFSLLARKGELKGKTFPIISGIPVMIGRDFDCNIVIPDDNASISRHHCVLDFEDGKLYIRDCRSSNGTYVNGQEISNILKYKNMVLEVARREGSDGSPKNNWVVLKLDDKVSIGGLNFTVEKSTTTVNISDPRLSTSELMPGYQSTQFKLIDHYKVISRIGKGASGDVYFVEDTDNGVFLALKMLNYRLQKEEVEIKRFLREVKNLGMLEHRNIIRVLDTGFKSGIYYFTTEYCNGGTVIDLMNDLGGKLPLDRAMNIMFQILDALEYAHSIDLSKTSIISKDDNKFGMVHRDIKPGNILLHHDGKKQITKIADFGLAKLRSGSSSLGFSTKTGTVGGTVEFISRQQMMNFKYARPDVDLWSAVAVLYYMLTGLPPRDFKNSRAPFDVILFDSPVPIRKRNNKISEGLAEVINQALDDDDVLMYQSAAKLKEDLKKAIKI